MLLPLFFLFTVVPLVELYFLFQIGDAFGWANTFLLVILTGVVGAYMARSQGRQIMMQVQKELANGGVPADGLVNGLLVFLGGILLITPGVFTDVVGFCFVMPVTRWILVRVLKTHFQNAVQNGKYKFQSVHMGGGPAAGSFHVYTSSQQWESPQQQQQMRDVVEVSAEKIEPPKS